MCVCVCVFVWLFLLFQMIESSVYIDLAMLLELAELAVLAEQLEWWK